MASSISIESVFLTFGFSVVTGLFFGGYPAYQASKMENRVSGSGAGGGSGSSGTGSGGRQLAGYVAGGAFNPLKDPSKTIGKDVATFYDYLKKKLNK